MKKNFILHGAMFMALGVALGAYASHGLKALSPESLYLFRLGVEYQIYHAIGLIAVGLMADKMDSKKIAYAGGLMFAGIVFFSGGLYFFALTEIAAVKYLIPVGGLCLIASWLMIIWAIFSQKDGQNNSQKGHQ